MKIIGILMEHVEEELDDAHSYAEMALEYKELYPGASDLFYRLSCEEMTHMEALHKEAVRMIEGYSQKHGEAPAAMIAVYEHLHKRYMKQLERLNALKSMFGKR